MFHGVSGESGGTSSEWRGRNILFQSQKKPSLPLVPRPSFSMIERERTSERARLSVVRCQVCLNSPSNAVSQSVSVHSSRLSSILSSLLRRVVIVDAHVLQPGRSHFAPRLGERCSALFSFFPEVTPCPVQIQTIPRSQLALEENPLLKRQTLGP